MNPQTDIVKELEELGSPLARMPRITPFAVPAGYFSAFPDTVQHIVSEHDPALNLPKAMPFAIPEGYFSTFSDTLQAIITAEDPALNISKTMPFALPENYFESFAAGIMDKATQPSFGQTAVPFDVPAGYFDNFAGNMLAAAKAADTAAIQAETPVATQKNTRTIRLTPQWKALRWAAAAVLVLGIGFGSYKMVNNNPAKPVLSTEKQLAMLDKNLISSYVQQNIDEFDMELLAEAGQIGEIKPEKNIPALNKKDIQQYLNEAESGASGIN